MTTDVLTATAQHVRRHPAIATTLVVLAQLMLILDATIVQVALPHIRNDLHFGASNLLWVINAYTLPYGGMLLFGGRLGDIRGRFRMFQIGLTLFTLASLAGGLAPTAGVLLAARAVQGVGAALTAPGVLALLTVNAPDEASRHRAFALFAAITSGGMTLGLVLGGILTDLASWRWTLLVNVPIGVAVLLLAPRFVTETGKRTGRLDVIGAITATLGAGGVVFGLVSAPDHGWSDPRSLIGLILGAVLLVAMWITESRSDHAMLDLAMLRNGPRVAALVASLLVIGAQMSTFYFVVQFLQAAGLTPLQTGLGFLPMSAGIFAVSRLAPKLVKRLGAAPLVLLGAALQAVAIGLFAFRIHGSGYFETTFASLLLDGIAIGLVMMPLTTIVLRNVPSERAGSVSGLLQTSQQLGAAAGLAVVVGVYAGHAVPGQFLPGAHTALLTAAGLSVLALLAGLTTVRAGFSSAAR